jgi:hypothetical protein
VKNNNNKNRNRLPKKKNQTKKPPKTGRPWLNRVDNLLKPFACHLCGWGFGFFSVRKLSSYLTERRYAFNIIASLISVINVLYISLH